MPTSRWTHALAFGAGAIAVALVSLSVTNSQAADRPLADRVSELESRVAALEGNKAASNTAQPQNFPQPLPYPIPLPLTLSEKVDALTTDVKTLQGQMSQALAAGQSNAGQIDSVNASLISLQARFAAHTHNLTINHPGAPCQALENFSMTTAAGVHENDAILFAVHCPGNNDTGFTPPWSETITSAAPN